MPTTLETTAGNADISQDTPSPAEMDAALNPETYMRTGPYSCPVTGAYRGDCSCYTCFMERAGYAKLPGSVFSPDLLPVPDPCEDEPSGEGDGGSEAEKPTRCTYDPSGLIGVPLGMFHCPECGEVVIAGMPHPDYSLLDEDGPAEFASALGPDEDPFYDPTEAEEDTCPECRDGKGIVYRDGVMVACPCCGTADNGEEAMTL